MSESAPADVPLRRTARQRLCVALGVVLTLCCVATAGVVVAAESTAGRLRTVDLSRALGSPGAELGDDAPRNVLIVGVDSADGLSPDDDVRAQRDAEGLNGSLRSDTIMVLRIEPSTTSAWMLSFPRDLWVELGDRGWNEKINAALPTGGPELLIETIRSNFEIPIDHYVQVDFAEFERLVDAVGGVRVPLTTGVRDDYTGLLIEEPGCVTFGGAQALAYVRSRHFEYLDPDTGRWVDDPTSDLGRISRQQDFVRRALERAVERGLRNPVTAKRLVDTGLEGIVVDDGLDAGRILDLVTAYRAFEPSQLRSFSLPVTFDTTAAGASIVRLVTRDAEPVLGLFRGAVRPEDVPEPVSSTTAVVRPSPTAVVTSVPATPASSTTAPRYGIVPTGDVSTICR